mmetsp:Transcript_7249/g.8265  ORF Transcript_7249/g.8265 Transcript_7249/m.8265 type:complete len:658 (-) Transcript_7249:192-2165(-)
MSSVREIEVMAASSCIYQSDCWITTYSDQPWSFTESKRDENSYPCNRLEVGTTIKIAPMKKQYGGWNQAHFHDNLSLPMNCNGETGVVVVLEALARECVAVALSPESDFVLGKTYVVHFGASGNMSTVIRRRISTNDEAVDVHFVSRVCSEESWISYWLCLSETGKVFAGVGKVPGQQCIGFLDDSLHHQLRTQKDVIRHIGLGNSALGKTAQQLRVRNVAVIPVPNDLQNKLEKLSSNDDFPLINTNAEGDDQEVQSMIKAYNLECKKAKARAKKFNIPYKEPNPQAFQNWSKLRRLRANPQKGFATGMDILAPEEIEKQQARATRFGISMGKRDRTTHEDAEEEEMMTTEMEEEEEEDFDEELVLPLNEAWDNEELVRPHRFDPPKTLWAKPPDTTIEDENQAVDSMEITTFTPEKIHLCSIDWAAFKQIRTDDIMAHFSIYGPSYVEWLGEISCNILFQDKFSASRALQNLAQQLPTPPPQNITENFSESSDLGNMGWYLGSHHIRKIANDRFGRRGTKARFLLRVAVSTDILINKPESTPVFPPGFSANRILGPLSEYDDSSQVERQKKRRKRELRRVPQQETEGKVQRNFRRESQQNKRRDSKRKPRRDFRNKTKNKATTLFSDSEHPLLSKGLASSRNGYSVEDMEAERAT